MGGGFLLSGPYTSPWGLELLELLELLEPGTNTALTAAGSGESSKPGFPQKSDIWRFGFVWV